MPSQNIDQLHGIDLFNRFPQIHHVERTCLYESIVRQLNIISNLDHSLDLLCVFALRIMIRLCHHYTIKTTKNQCDHSLNDQHAEQMYSLRTEKIPNPE
jgi:hypothetical protein